MAPVPAPTHQLCNYKTYFGGRCCCCWPRIGFAAGVWVFGPTWLGGFGQARRTLKTVDGCCYQADR